MDPLTLTLVMGVVAFAAIVQLATGFGFALVSVPLLALVTEPHAAVLIALQVGTIGNAYQAVEGRRRLDRAVVARILVGASIGLPVGWWIYAHSSASVLKVLIGIAILLTVGMLARGLVLKSASRPIDLVAGTLTGILTTCTGTNGPPIVTVLHARKVTPEVFRATTSTVFCVLDVLAVAVFAVSGHLTGSLVVTAAWTVPGLAAGAWVGIRARQLLSPTTFRILVLVLLSATGATAILTAVV